MSRTPGRLLVTGKTAEVWLADPPSDGVLKIALDPSKNGLLVGEAMRLSLLRDEREGKTAAFFPELLEHYEGTDGRAVNVFRWEEGFVTLKEVRAAYPDGIDPKHMAWIWRRLLVPLGVAHAAELAHRQVQPRHVVVHPVKHGVILLDWTRAKPTDGGEAANDLRQAAAAMIYLLGGDPEQRNFPPGVPLPIRSHLRSVAAGTAKAPAGEVLRGFDEVIARLWGRRRYKALEMPAPA